MNQPNQVMSPQMQRLATFAAVLFFILFLLGLYFLRSICIPIIVSYFLAFLINPLVDRAENMGFGRSGPIVLLLLFGFGFAGMFIGFLMPKMASQLHGLVGELPAIADLFVQQVQPYIELYLGIDLLVEWNRLAISILPTFSKIPSGGVFGSVFSGTMQALGTVLIVLMIPILTYYISKDYNGLNERFLALVPRRFLTNVSEVVKRMSDMLGSLVRGQFLICLMLAVYYAVALSAVQLNYSLVIGAVAGLLNLIPFVGPVIGALFAISVSVIGDGTLTMCITIAGIFIVASLINNTVLQPKIVGKQMTISPVTMILVLLAGGELLGFLGMLLALPVTAMIKVLGGYFAERYFASEFYQHQVEKNSGESVS